MSRSLCALFFTSLVATAACSRAAAPPPAAIGGTKAVDPATTGVVVGRVAFDGTPPAPEPLRMQTDKSCLQGDVPNPVSDAVLVGATGGLKNAFVYVKSGLDPEYSYDVPTTPVTLDQKGCVYTPRVIGVMTGQPLEVINSDATLHNVHALPRANDEFNRAQRLKGERMTQSFSLPEVMVRFKCDVHGWMAAYVGVTSHPFFAVTDAEGKYEIKGLPPGEYTLAIWHERLGTKEQTVTVGPKETRTVDYTVSSANGSSN